MDESVELAPESLYVHAAAWQYFVIDEEFQLVVYLQASTLDPCAHGDSPKSHLRNGLKPALMPVRS
ncbi:hypothetical protein D3C76_1385290 [compost metagenome]